MVMDLVGLEEKIARGRKGVKRTLSVRPGREGGQEVEQDTPTTHQGTPPPPPCPFSLSNTNYLPKATSSNTITLGIRGSICELQQGRGHGVGNKNSESKTKFHAEPVSLLAVEWEWLELLESCWKQSSLTEDQVRLRS